MAASFYLSNPHLTVIASLASPACSSAPSMFMGGKCWFMEGKCLFIKDKALIMENNAG
jgi:hypothetical protein